MFMLNEAENCGERVIIRIRCVKGLIPTLTKSFSYYLSTVSQKWRCVEDTGGGGVVLLIGPVIRVVESRI